MEIKFVIVLVACLSCLVRPGLGTPLTIAATKAAAVGLVKVPLIAATKAAAVGLVKVPLIAGTALAVGAGAGLAAKGALAVVAKKTLLGIILKAAALKAGALLGAKALTYSGATALLGVGSAKAAYIKDIDAKLAAEGKSSTTPRTPLRDVVHGTARVMQAGLKLSEAIAYKSRALYRVMSNVPKLIDPTVEYYD